MQLFNLADGLSVVLRKVCGEEGTVLGQSHTELRRYYHPLVLGAQTAIRMYSHEAVSPIVFG